MLRTPLHEAVCLGSTSMVKLLLEAGSDPNMGHPKEGSPLLQVGVISVMGVISVICTGMSPLRMWTPSVCRHDDGGGSAGVHVMHRGSCSKTLLQTPATPSRASLCLRLWVNILRVWQCSGKVWQCLSQVLQYNMSVCCGSVFSLLCQVLSVVLCCCMQAAAVGATDIVQLLLDAGADVAAVDVEGLTGAASHTSSHSGVVGGCGTGEVHTCTGHATVRVVKQ